MQSSLVERAEAAIPLHAIAAADLEAVLEAQAAPVYRFAKAAGFGAKAGEILAIPDGDGTIAAILFGLGKHDDPLILAAAAEKLAHGTYYLASGPLDPQFAALGWLYGSYAFTRYKNAERKPPVLVLPQGADGAEVGRIAEGICLGRDLVATPACDLGPEELAAAAQALAERHGAACQVITGPALLEQNFPMIHAVGSGSVRAPRLIDLTWGAAHAPKVTLVGKGVCFDSGGLDLKPSSAMLTMKKDMGGAAAVLALAHMVMDAKLPIRLRVLIPAVENSISATAYRPGDVLASRKGLMVEIGNTDAEGRLILADALALADAEAPELLIDIATLTGAARQATGMEVPPFFTDDEALASDLSAASFAVQDPLWRLPLWRGYEATLDSTIADLNNAPSYNLAGAITAALFLNRFVEKSPWIHLDIPAWNDRARPGRKVGPEVNAARALYCLLRQRYAR